MQENRRILRKNMTPAEAFLWKHLKSKKLNGKRFQRQPSIKNYIVDFYCASKKLIIELGGEVHNHPETVEKNEVRTTQLNTLGFTVIRFENRMVFDHLPSVLSAIQQYFNIKNKPQKSSSL
ncbi:endonuclease domain-containing protein [Aquimarina gracilis]|uniref:endonuclease domain-containing protein n=1 Tax=Aquimarina gracilis TaxID=874422 RepID=UPI0031D39E00